MALVPLQHSPADQGTPLYPAARQSILVRLVGKVIAQGRIPAGVWGVLTQSLTLVGVWDLPLQCVASHDLCFWSFYYEAVSGLADDLKGV